MLGRASYTPSSTYYNVFITCMNDDTGKGSKRVSHKLNVKTSKMNGEKSIPTNLAFTLFSAKTLKLCHFSNFHSYSSHYWPLLTSIR